MQPATTLGLLYNMVYCVVSTHNRHHIDHVEITRYGIFCEFKWYIFSAFDIATVYVNCLNHYKQLTLSVSFQWHLNRNIIFLTKFLSLAAPEVFKFLQLSMQPVIGCIENCHFDKICDAACGKIGLDDELDQF